MHRNMLLIVLSLAAAQCAVASYVSTVLADNPIGYWRLAEAPGSLVSVDSSGHGHNGVYEGNGILGVPGLVNDPNTAVNFNTTGDVRIANAPDLNFVNVPFTLEAWVNGTMTVTSRRIYDKALAGTGNGYGLDVAQSNIRLLGANPPGNFQADLLLMSNTTYYIVGVSNGAGTGFIYVNGVLVASGPYSSSNPYLGDAHIAVASDGTVHFNGTIDEVAVYNYALTSAQIRTHYQAGSVPEPGTWALMSLEG